MTAQEIFDRVATHLLKQGRKSISARMDDDGGILCAYRGADGTRCAVGCLIPDEHYDAGIEDYRVFAEPVANALMAAGVVKEVSLRHHDDRFRLLGELQWLHDQRSVEEWPDALRAVSTNYGLSPAVLA
jgi:hypothetical protein